MNAPATFPPPRVTANLSHAFGGVWRLTWCRFLQWSHWGTLLIGLGVLALLSLGSEGPRRLHEPRHYIQWVVNFYITFLVPAIAFMAAASAMREEMKATTLDYVLTRPIPRPAFLGCKYLSHLACIQLDLLFAFVVVLAVGSFRGVTGLMVVVPQLLVCQVLLATAFTAFGFLCGSLTTRYVVIGLIYGGLIEAGVGQIPTQLSRLSMTHQVRELLVPVVDHAVAAASVVSWLGTIALLLAFTAFMLTAAATVFSVSEHSGRADP
jgi:ABC-type transport system involved in multi-copper enzyme maturation permease subunit